MTRAAATDLERLDDYVRGQGTDDEWEAYELRLFARAVADDAPELAFRDSVAAAFSKLKGTNTLDLWLTSRDVERLRASGVRAAFLEYDTTNPQASLPTDVDLLVMKVPLDLADIETLDVDVIAPDGRLLKRMPDVAFDRADGAIYACCDIELARIAAGSGRIAQVWGTGAGGRRLLAEMPA